MRFLLLVLITCCESHRVNLMKTLYVMHIAPYIVFGISFLRKQCRVPWIILALCKNLGVVQDNLCSLVSCGLDAIRYKICRHAQKELMFF